MKNKFKDGVFKIMRFSLAKFELMETVSDIRKKMEGASVTDLEGYRHELQDAFADFKKATDGYEEALTYALDVQLKLAKEDTEDAKTRN